MRLNLYPYYIFALAMALSNVHAIEFTQCIDSNGNRHISNLNPETLDKDCQPVKDYHDMLLHQDYQNLDQQIANYAQAAEEEAENDESLVARAQDSIKNLLPPSINDLLDPDKALEQLLENTREQPQNSATKLFKARSDAVEKVMETEKYPNPDT